jgi:hypothetical protein
MRFSCGENWETKRTRLQKWHPFFAIWPRTVSVENGKDICVWLGWIERQGHWYGRYWIWTYREKK